MFRTISTPCCLTQNWCRKFASTFKQSPPYYANIFLLMTLIVCYFVRNSLIVSGSRISSWPSGRNHTPSPKRARGPGGWTSSLVSYACRDWPLICYWFSALERRQTVIYCLHIPKSMVSVSIPQLKNINLLQLISWIFADSCHSDYWKWTGTNLYFVARCNSF